MSTSSFMMGFSLSSEPDVRLSTHPALHDISGLYPHSSWFLRGRLDTKVRSCCEYPYRLPVEPAHGVPPVEIVELGVYSDGKSGRFAGAGLAECGQNPSVWTCHPMCLHPSGHHWFWSNRQFRAGDTDFAVRPWAIKPLGRNVPIRARCTVPYPKTFVPVALVWMYRSTA